MGKNRKYREHRLTRTKIIATVGPACGNRETLKELVAAGVDIFRLNFAHGTQEWLAEIVVLIREISAELGIPIGILGDLSGPKIRLGKLPDDGVLCSEGAEFTFVRGRQPQTRYELTCTYEALIDDVQVDDRVLLADGAVVMRVVEKDAQAGLAKCVVESSGTVRSRQGVNLPGVALSTPSLTEKDRMDLAWAIEHDLDYVGLSFVRRVSDVTELRQAIVDHGSDCQPRIVAKIEKGEAVQELEAIVDEADAVMVARGDLGVEVDIVQVPAIQKRIIRLCNQRRVPVITATQMLDSMQRSELPTRAEASDVANAVLDGTDAVMLSGETAVGLHPRQSVAMMSRIVCEAEKLLPEETRIEDLAIGSHQALRVTEAVAVGAVATARELGAALIAVATTSGRSALAISKERSRVPILAFTNSERAARRMALLWGVTPKVSGQAVLTADQVALKATEWGLSENVLAENDTVVVMASSRWSAEGHDSMLVHVVD
ncbi:pyruvate kinase [bacterium]|nr:pyruvate kinase [bacterium]